MITNFKNKSSQLFSIFFTHLDRTPWDDLFYIPTDNKSAIKRSCFYLARCSFEKCLKFLHNMINFNPIPVQIFEIIFFFEELKNRLREEKVDSILPTHFITIKKRKLRAQCLFLSLLRFMFNATYFLCTIHKDQQRFMWFYVTNYSLLHD